MRENLNPLIKCCVTRTVPGTETESIGQAADARVSWFLHTTTHQTAGPLYLSH